MLSLGFAEKTAKIFLKFRSKGFIFKHKQDLKKVFGISDNFYNKLESYILIKSNLPEQKNNLTIENKSNITEVKPEAVSALKNKNNSTIELNSADSLTLLEINGIGPSFAKRILKYRVLLGGFSKIDQLKEVYGFTDELYDKIKLQVLVNATLIKKLNLNKTDFKTINKHPYLSYELTKSIFEWKRKTNITKENISGILNDEVLYQKLIPYLEF